MTAGDVEQQIRRHPTANERFLLGLLDEARAVAAYVQDLRRLDSQPEGPGVGARKMTDKEIAEAESKGWR